MFEGFSEAEHGAQNAQVSRGVLTAVVPPPVAVLMSVFVRTSTVLWATFLSGCFSLCFGLLRHELHVPRAT